MINVSFLGQDIPMSKYVYAYGACLRLFDSYKKRLLQCFDAVKGNGREAIEKGINEEIERIVNDVIGKAMSEDIYSVASSDIRRNQAYMTYIDFCKSHRWRSEYYDQCYRELKEVLCGVIDGMMKCYLTILEENERFDSTRIEKFSREHSDEIISLLQNSPDKKRTIICAFSDWPYNATVYEAAFYYNLMDFEACQICEDMLGKEGLEAVAIRSVVAQKKKGRNEALCLLSSAFGEEFANKISGCADDLWKKEWEATRREKSEKEAREKEAKRLEEEKKKALAKEKAIETVGKTIAIALAIIGLLVILGAFGNNSSRNERRKCFWCNGTGYNGNGARNATEYVFMKTPCTKCGGDGYFD